MNKLYASTIELILLDLDLAIRHSDTPHAVEECVNRARSRLLRAALADVEVEAVSERRIAA